MHHSKDEDEIMIQRVDNTVGKPTGLTPPNILFKNRPRPWETENILNCRMDFDGEIVAQAWLATFIIVDGVQEFRLCFRMKGEIHLERRF